MCWSNPTAAKRLRCTLQCDAGATALSKPPAQPKFAVKALVGKRSAPSRVWNHIASEVHDQIIEQALEHSELSPRELAVRVTDERHYFLSEATVYRLLKAHDRIASPNEMLQTDFTSFKIIGWGWMYLSTVLADKAYDAVHLNRYVVGAMCSTAPLWAWH